MVLLVLALVVFPFRQNNYFFMMDSFIYGKNRNLSHTHFMESVDLSEKISKERKKSAKSITSLTLA